MKFLCKIFILAATACFLNAALHADFVNLNGSILRDQLLDDVRIEYTNPDNNNEKFTDPGILTSLFQIWGIADDKFAMNKAEEKIKVALGTPYVLSECSEVGCALTRIQGFISLRDLVEVKIAKMIINVLKGENSVDYASIGAGRLFTDTRIFERVCKSWDGGEKSVIINFWDIGTERQSFDAFKSRVSVINKDDNSKGMCGELTLNFFNESQYVTTFKSNQCPAILVAVDMGGEGYAADGAENDFIKLFYDCRDKVEDNLLVTPGLDVGENGHWMSTEDFYKKETTTGNLWSGFGNKPPALVEWEKEKHDHRRVRFVTVVKKGDADRIEKLKKAGYVEKNDWPIFKKSTIKKLEKWYNPDVANAVTTYVKDFVFDEKGLETFKKALNDEKLWFDPKTQGKEIKKYKEEIELARFKKVVNKKDWAQLTTFEIPFLTERYKNGPYFLHEMVNDFWGDGEERAKQKQVILDTIKTLVKKGFSIDEKNRVGQTVLFLAVQKPELLSLILSLHPNVNAKNNNGDTPLFMATTKDAVQMLLKAGASIDIKNKVGETAFDHFLVTQQMIAMSALLEARPAMVLSESIKYNDVETSVLYLALHQFGWDDNCKDIVDLLLKKGADVQGKYNFPGVEDGPFTLKELQEASKGDTPKVSLGAQAKRVVEDILAGKLGETGAGNPEDKGAPLPEPEKTEDRLLNQLAGAFGSMIAKEG